MFASFLFESLDPLGVSERRRDGERPFDLLRRELSALSSLLSKRGNAFSRTAPRSPIGGGSLPLTALTFRSELDATLLIGIASMLFTRIVSTISSTCRGCFWPCR